MLENTLNQDLGPIYPNQVCKEEEKIHTMFVRLQGAIDITYRTNKPNATKLTRCLAKNGVENVAEVHEKANRDSDNPIQEQERSMTDQK